MPNTFHTSPLFVDAERIPDSMISDIFRPPPSLPDRFNRSTLVVGTRGSGKTLLFRHLRAQHNGIALHIILSKEFAPITGQTGEGALCYESDPQYRSSVPGMATTLLAISICRSVLDRLPDLSPESVRRFSLCLPLYLRPQITNLTPQSLSAASEHMMRAQNAEFAGLAETRALSQFVGQIGAELADRGLPLLLLIDKPDQVSPLSLKPVFELLDQSASYVALLATRPGQAGKALEELSKIIIPGDHYDIQQLGAYPRSSAWREFMLDAAMAQLSRSEPEAEAFNMIDPQKLRWVLAASRDSVRTALELISTLVPPNGLDDDRLRQAAIDRRQDILVALRQAQNEVPDASAVFREIRRGVRIGGSAGQRVLRIPVELCIVPSAASDLFRSYERVGRFIDSALRCGALSMPEGQPWFPGLQPTELEIAPLVLWERDAPFVIDDTGDPHFVQQTERELRETRGHFAPREETIFVAYDFADKRSMEFRQILADRAEHHPNFRNFRVVDGKLLPGGGKWKDIIKKRIDGATAVVADLSRMRPEVLVEIGFAFGRQKRRLYVTGTGDERVSLPSWLTEDQFGSFDSGENIDEVMSGLEVLIGSVGGARARKLPGLVASKATILNASAWPPTIIGAMEDTLRASGIRVDRMEGDYRSDDLNHVVSSALIIALFDGTSGDAFVHFASGAALAKQPTIFQFKRRLLFSVAAHVRPENVIADSLRRADIVAVHAMDNIVPAVAQFGDKYRKWARSAGEK
jgi:hypothetical protein